MVPIVPTWWQRLLANRMLKVILIFTASAASTVWIVASVGPIRYAFGNSWAIGLAAVIGALSFVASFFAALILFPAFASPLLRAQGRRNGGPFKPGDLVQIISGPHHNRIARVDSYGQHETVQLDLGENSTPRFDTYAAFELLRIEGSEPTDS